MSITPGLSKLSLSPTLEIVAEFQSCATVHPVPGYAYITAGASMLGNHLGSIWVCISKLLESCKRLLLSGALLTQMTRSVGARLGTASALRTYPLSWFGPGLGVLLT